MERIPHTPRTHHVVNNVEKVALRREGRTSEDALELFRAECSACHGVRRGCNTAVLTVATIEALVERGVTLLVSVDTLLVDTFECVAGVGALTHFGKAN